MNPETKASWIAFAALAIIFTTVGFVLAFAIVVAQDGHPRHVFEDEAVREGAGEYYLDNDHNRKFRWKATKP